MQLDEAETQDPLALMREIRDMIRELSRGTEYSEIEPEVYGTWMYTVLPHAES